MQQGQREHRTSINPRKDYEAIKALDHGSSFEDPLCRRPKREAQHSRALSIDAGVEYYEQLDNRTTTGFSEALEIARHPRPRPPERHSSVDSAIARVFSFTTRSTAGIGSHRQRIPHPLYLLKSKHTHRSQNSPEEPGKKDTQHRKVRYWPKVIFSHRNLSSEVLPNNNSDNVEPELRDTSIGPRTKSLTNQPSRSKPSSRETSSRYELFTTSPSHSKPAGSKVPRTAESECSSTIPTPPNSEPKPGLYCRTKKRLGFKVPSAAEERVEAYEGRRSVTEETLIGVSGLLQDVAERKAFLPLAVKRRSNLSVGDMSHSASSSIYSIARGRTPVATPDTVAYYKGSDDQGHLRVEISSHNAPNFLPSEAQSVGALTKGGRLAERSRGFFFDYRTPEANLETPTVSRKISAHRHQDLDDETGDPAWFRWKAMQKSEEETVDAVEQDIPEHLPNSPLCPAHLKHSSKGKGFCPVHGRRPRTSDES